MNAAQQQWKEMYSEWIESRHTFDSLRIDMLDIRREAALERRCEAQQREIDRLKGQINFLSLVVDIASYNSQL